MGLDPDARLVVKRGIDLRKLPLTPVEFFLFSRVEALTGAEPPTVANVIAASGQSSADASAALQKLVGHGVLSLGRAASPAAAARAAPHPEPDSPRASELRERARSRRHGLLEAQMRLARGPQAGTGRAAEGGRPEPGQEDSLPTPSKSREPSSPSSALRSILDEVEPVAATDPRLQPSASVDLDRQRRLLALRDRLRHIGHFELLGLEPVDDPKVIRRAYHVVSREFHPDSFYGKNLGGFRGVLDDLFRRARASYELLLDDERRKPLVEAHLASRRVAQDRLERDRLAAQTKAETKAAEDRRVAQEAQVARDQKRQQRIKDRALLQRRQKAAKQAEQARREQAIGRHGTAATLFRLAHEQDPAHGEYEQLWRESLATARRQRAEASLEQARAARREGRAQDAAHHFAGAADAEPSLRNLSEAAAAVAKVDPSRARDYALAALETLEQAKARGQAPDNQSIVDAHVACATAFLAAGQVASAKEQAERAHELAPSTQTRTLLNSIKLT